MAGPSAMDGTRVRPVKHYLGTHGNQDAHLAGPPPESSVAVVGIASSVPLGGQVGMPRNIPCKAVVQLAGPLTAAPH